MNLPEVKNPNKYVGLYVIDFGDHSGVGYTADEVVELLESEKFADVKVYKIHNVYPDGKMELKGVPAETFQLESGMFFYSRDEVTAQRDFKTLVDIAVTSAPPCRAKAHLAKHDDNQYAVALIYPAEYEDEISIWLIDNNYKTKGAAEGGTSAVTRYYDAEIEILQRHQFINNGQLESRTGDMLLISTKLAVVR